MGKAIEVSSLSKVYHLGEVGTGTISKDFERFWAKLRGKDDPFLKIGETNDRAKKGITDVVLSLNDLNFEIEKGDAVGIIGRNGAGKSTLLKILSRVTGPSSGTINIRGRIASLLEVGTGFHPELTGRENIFLNGAILGMRKAEIKRKFDEIVDFSGVERYIETPVKRYSSGMYVRLAFAVAAYLESEILILDEVLAVGDAEFQKKCLGKMNDVSKGEGRTILFVSHNLGSISQLCNRTILLRNGILEAFEQTDAVIRKYLNDNNQVFTISNLSTDTNCYRSAQMQAINGTPKSTFEFDEDLKIALKVNIADYYSGMQIALRLVDALSNPIFTIHENIGQKKGSKNIHEFNIVIPGKFVTPGNYSWIICINHPGVKLYDLLENVLPFTIEETGSVFSRYNNVNYGVVFPTYEIERL